MPARWERNVRPGDLTGNIGKELHRKAQLEVEKKMRQQTLQIEKMKAEIEAARSVIPVAIHTWNDEDVIDYTGDYHGYEPDKQYNYN